MLLYRLKWEFLWGFSIFPRFCLYPNCHFPKVLTVLTHKSTIWLPSMESTPPSNQLPGDNNNAAGEDSNNITPASYFQKTICLQDWWLIKADKDGEGEKLGVAGFTSREQPALRLFSSAPITKYYDMFTLETMDGFCVVLNGLINKSRTLENGFSSEVFTHFIMGFPPYWEHFAENYLRRGSSAGVVSRGVEDHGNMIPETGQCGTASNESSVQVPKLLSFQNASDGYSLKDFKLLNNMAYTLFSVEQEPKSNTDSGLNSKDLRNSKNLGDDVIVDGTAMGSPPPKTSSFNNDTPLTVNQSVLVESIRIDPGCLESSVISKRSVKVALSFQNPVAVNCDKGNSHDVDGSSSTSSAAEVTEKVPSPALGNSSILELSGNLLGVEGSSLPSAGAGVIYTESSPVVENSHTCVDDSTMQCEVLSELERTVALTDINMDVNVSMISKERNNCEIENLSNYQKESASSGCGATMRKSRTRSSVAKARLGNPEKENSNSKSSNLPVGFGVGRDFDEATMFSEGRILTRQLSKSKRKQGDQKAAGVLEDERIEINHLPVGSSDQTENADADVKSESTRCKGGTQKKTKKAGRSTSRHGVTDKKHCSKIAVEVNETVSEDVSPSGKKTARKLTYGSPVKKGKEDASTIPIEFFSCKRSRSGRLLLPSLEFWRNQMLVYDGDGRITGIKEDRCTVQPSRGSKSEPPKKKSKADLL